MKRQLLAALLCVLLLPLGCAGVSEKIVGKDVKKTDIRDFYWTYDTSTYPPEFLRYRFYVEDSAYRFFWERREGNVWPLTEEHRTASGTLTLSDAEWDALWNCLENGCRHKAHGQYELRRQRSVDVFVLDKGQGRVAGVFLCVMGRGKTIQRAVRNAAGEG